MARAGLRSSVILSAGLGVLVVLWGRFGHGRPLGGTLLAGSACAALGAGTAAVLRARPHAVLTFATLAALYFATLTGIHWILGSEAGGIGDALGGLMYGGLLTWLSRSGAPEVRLPARRSGGGRP